jgi:hypothetical protein
MINHPNRSKDIYNRPITITLTGARWFALLAGIEGKPLSEQGCLAREAAITGIKAVLLEVSK